MYNLLFATTAGLFAFGAILIILEHRIHGPQRCRKRSDWLKYWIFVPIILSLMLVAHYSRVLVIAILGLIALGGVLEIYRNLHKSFRLLAAIILFPTFLFSLGHLMAGDPAVLPTSFSMAVLFVATMDAFSQLWGRLLGRHKLCPRLSPGKTVEGLCGGVLTTAAVATLLGFWMPHMVWTRLVSLALLTAGAGLAGDLSFSAIKRAIGIKDFSSLLPGHGGVLDRFDSLIVAAPVYYWARVWLFG